MDEMDKKILAFLQGDIPLEKYPYRQLSEEMGITEEEILARIENLKKAGIIRRCGAVLRHQKSGYNFNALVAWRVGIPDADQAGAKMAAFNEVSHCYLRVVPKVFNYNLFTMIHARNETDLQSIIAKMVKKTGINSYTVLKSIKELKKSSMKYF